MKYVDDSIKLSPYRQFCCPVSLTSTSPFANIPVSPRFFGEFDMVTFTARQFEKPLIPSSTQLTRKPPNPWVGHLFQVMVTSSQEHCTTDFVQRINQFKLGSVGGLNNAFSSYQLKTKLKNNSDCLLGPTIGQWHKSPSNGPSTSYPGALGLL